MIRIRIANIPSVQPATVRAVKVGCFAIHHGNSYEEDFFPRWWCVTHIPSGRLVGYFWQAQNAKRFADWLMTLPLDWRRMYGRKTVRALIRRKMRREIRTRLHQELMPNSVVGVLGWAA